MKRRDFLNSSLLAAAVTVPGIRAAYAVVGTGQVADLAAVTGDGREITLRGTDIRDLAAKMRGQLLLAGRRGIRQGAPGPESVVRQTSGPHRAAQWRGRCAGSRQLRAREQPAGRGEVRRPQRLGSVDLRSRDCRSTCRDFAACAWIRARGAPGSTAARCSARWITSAWRTDSWRRSARCRTPAWAA